MNSKDLVIELLSQYPFKTKKSSQIKYSDYSSTCFEVTEKFQLFLLTDVVHFYIKTPDGHVTDVELDYDHAYKTLKIIKAIMLLI